MTNLKKILITTESREIFIIRTCGKNGVRAFCEFCRTETEVLTIDEAVSFSNCKTLELLGRIQTGDVHSIETASGHLLICLKSLTQKRGNLSETNGEQNNEKHS